MLLLLRLKLLHRMLLHKILLYRKPLVDVDEPLDKPLYALDFLRSLTKQKEKRRNSRYRKRSRPTHLQMSLKAFTTL
jgi:hypothetical protein